LGMIRLWPGETGKPSRITSVKESSLMIRDGGREQKGQ